MCWAECFLQGAAYDYENANMDERRTRLAIELFDGYVQNCTLTIAEETISEKKKITVLARAKDDRFADAEMLMVSKEWCRVGRMIRLTLSETFMVLDSLTP